MFITPQRERDKVVTGFLELFSEFWCRDPRMLKAGIQIMLALGFFNRVEIPCVVLVSKLSFLGNLKDWHLHNEIFKKTSLRIEH